MSYRTETLLNSIASGEPSGVTPKTREEAYLSYIAGESDTYPTTPTTRKEFYLDKIAQNGAGGGSSGGESTEMSKLAQLVDKSITEIKASDLEGATKIGHSSFKYCSELISIEIPSSVKGIWEYAFDGCSKLSRVSLPNGLIRISTRAFSECQQLGSIEIPNTVSMIDGSAFNGCTSLIRVTIGSRIEDIGSSAFLIGSTTNKATITILATKPPLIKSNSIGANVEKIIVPKGCLSAYQTATNWASFADKMEEATE